MNNIIKNKIVKTSISLEEYIPFKVLIDRKNEPVKYLSYSKDKTSLLEIAVGITSCFISRITLLLSKEYDINKVDILTKVKDNELMKEITDIMYLDISGADKEKLLSDVLKVKQKEKLYLRRDEIFKRLDQDISKDEREILQLELNQIILEISKLKK